MKKLISILFVVMFIGVLASAQQSGVPEKVAISLDALLKTRTSNQVFNMKSVHSYFFASQNSVYVNVLFTADIEKDWKDLKTKVEAEHETRMAEYNKFVEREQKKLEEANKKIREKNRDLPMSQRMPEKTWEKPAPPELIYPGAYHNLFIRVVQDGQTIQQYKSPIPFNDEETEYYSFGLILAPGKYTLLMNINRYDDSLDGTLLVELEVPKLTVTDMVAPAKEITMSTPIFYKKVNTLNVVENRFTVAKNCYQIDPIKQGYHPYIDSEYKFKSSDSPILTFFISGVNPPWNVEVKMSVNEGKKKLVSFKVPAMENPYFFQPVEFIDKDKAPLKPGDYVLSISLTDNNNKTRKGEIEIPFKIID